MDDATLTASASPADSPTPTTAARVPAPLRYCDRERYEVRGEQGRGGLGLVLRAHDRELGRDVAVKELLGRGNTSELRFFREALITSRLEHPGIVPVHEAGRWSDGTPFYTMKLVGGRSLHARLAEQRVLEGRLAFLPNVIAVADAIAYAHDRGVIHRDLKPSNVMVGDFGETIVIDWGLAKVLDETADVLEDDVPYRSAARNDLTAVGSVLGTPAYMAPEQYAGRVDHRTDVYALGGILHELLTGRPPHEVAADGDITSAELEYTRKTPADLIAIAQRALERDPAKRYQTARAFADDLRRYIRRDRVAARRYSVAARLALAFARHRAVALVVMTALVALTVTFAIALFNVREERAQAIAARETAVINSAAAMLERDPTRAWEILAGVPRSASPALLRARIQAAGVAERSITLPGTFDRIAVLRAGNRVVIGTGERTLHTLDTRSGELVDLVDGLTEPAHWATTDDHVYFIRETSPLSLAIVPVDGGPVEELATLPTIPVYMLASDRGAFWLANDGTLHHAARNQVARIAAVDVASFALVGSQLVTCDSDGELRVGDPEQERAVIGACKAAGTWIAGSQGFVHFAEDRLHVYEEGRLRSRTIEKTDVMAYAQLTETGLLAGVGAGGDALLLRPGATAVERVPVSGRPEIVAAHGRVAGWSFSNGAVELFDTEDGRYWSMQASKGMPRCFSLLTDDRVITCDRREVRVWTLPRAAPRIVTTIPAVTNNVAFNASHHALFDGIDGRGYVLERGEKQAVAVHEHTNVSFGVAWCDSQACTSGWDGRVMCTDVATGTSRVAADLESVTPWIAEGGGHCFTAAASGGIYDLRSPTKPVYEHRHEPYRIAVSLDGNHVASGDWGGDLVVYDARSATVTATLHGAHSGRVTGIAWSGDNLISSGSDGTLRLWSSGLDLLRTWRVGSSIRYLDVKNGTVGFALDDGSLWMISARGSFEHHVAMGIVFTAVAVSPDGAFVAAGTNDADLVVLSADNRAAATGFGDGHIPCVGFENDSSVIVCTRSGKLMQVPLSALSFQSSSGENGEED